MMLIEQIGPQGQTLLQRRFEGTGAECRVGRDLACDIVVDDEYVAPLHVQLMLLADGRVSVRDLGTRNGTRVNGTWLAQDADAVIERAEIVIGRTRLHVRTQRAAIAPERALRRNLLVHRYRTLLAAAGVSACIAFAGFLQWLDAPSSMLRGVMVAALVALGLIAVWTGSWALISKLNLGRWRVRVHLAIASIAAAFCAWGYWVAGLVAYATQWSVLVRMGGAVAGAVVLAALYLHLREATHYGRRTALALGGTATLVIAAIAWSIAIGVEDSSVNRVDLGPEVRLGARRVVPNQDVADYLADVDELQRDAGRLRQKSLLSAPLAEAED